MTEFGEPCEHMQEVVDFVLEYEHRTPVKLEIKATCNICKMSAVLDEEDMAVHDRLAVKLMQAVNDAVRRVIGEEAR